MYLEPWLVDSIRVTPWFLRAVPALCYYLFHPVSAGGYLKVISREAKRAGR
jgi:hypothetical protein